MKKVLFITIMVLLAGCGKKGALILPEALVPAPIADLKVAQQGERFVVSWSRPDHQEGGGMLRDLAGFHLFRREVLPPGEDCEECPTAYRLITSVDLQYPKGVAVFGDHYYFIDGDPATGKSFRYKVVSEKKDGIQSRASNRADRKKRAAPQPPVVQALASPSEIDLHWQAVAMAGNGKIEGYNVYRKRNGENFPPAPLNSTPVREAVFKDSRLEDGVKYVYAVRTVAVIEGETVESELSNEVEATLSEPD
jgi:predicted small lipoprotein YifL